MKKILLALLACVTFTATADEKSQQVLGQLSKTLDAYKNYEVRFQARAKGQMPDVDGYYIVGGRSYYIKVKEREVYSDGRTKYEVDTGNKEVMVSRVDPEDRNILSNPTRAFEFLDGSFRHTYKGNVILNGVNCDEILLTPAKRGSVSDVTLFIDTETGLPYVLRYWVEGLTIPVEVTVHKFSPLTEVKPSSIEFDAKKYKNYEIIDFR